MSKYSKYEGVGIKKLNGVSRWVCRYKGDTTTHDDERAAAKNYDLRLIKDGKNPTNILKPVKKEMNTYSKYTGVYPAKTYVKSKKALEGYWLGKLTHKGQIFAKHFKEERDAALWYDKKRISLGLDPVNILKPKK